MAELFCDVCDRDASETVVLADWHGCQVCTDCLTHKEAMDAEEAAACECLDCFRHAVQHQ
jgi:hypothetical protein